MLPYLPKAAQLKLFRYALSRLDFLDQATYDLERDFDLSLGRNNILEMRNVGLNVEKIARLCSLPKKLRLVEAQVRILRIKIPTDFYRAPVEVNVDGVDVVVVLDACEAVPDSKAPEPDSHVSISSASLPMQESTTPEDGDDDDEDDSPIPSVESLAASFIQERPLEAQDIQSMLYEQTKGSTMQQSEIEFDDDDEDEDVGFGIHIPLWNFVPNFFRRLANRLEVQIKSINVSLRVPSGSQPSELLQTFPSLASLHNGVRDSISIHLIVAALEIEGVTTMSSKESKTDTEMGSQSKGQDFVHEVEKRTVRLLNVQVALVGHPDKFLDDTSKDKHQDHDDGDAALDVASSKSDSTILPVDTRDATLSCQYNEDQSLPLDAPFINSSMHSISNPTHSMQQSMTNQIDHNLSEILDPISTPRALTPVAKNLETVNYASSPLSESPASSSSSSSGDYDDQLMSQSLIIPHPPPRYNSSNYISEDEDEEPIPQTNPAQSYNYDPYEDGISELGNVTSSLLSEANRHADFDDKMTTQNSHEWDKRYTETTSLSTEISRPHLEHTSDEIYSETHLIEPPVFYHNSRHSISGQGQGSHYDDRPLDENEEDEYSDPEEHYLSQRIERSSSSSDAADQDEFPFSTSRAIPEPARETAHGTILTVSSSSSPSKESFLPEGSTKDEDLSSEDGSVYASYPNSEQDAIEQDDTLATEEDDGDSSVVKTAAEYPPGTQCTQDPTTMDKYFDQVKGSSMVDEITSHTSNDLAVDMRPKTLDNSTRSLAEPTIKRTIVNTSGKLVQSSSGSKEERKSDFESDKPTISSRHNLSQSMLFSSEEADSLYMSALGGSVETSKGRIYHDQSHNVSDNLSESRRDEDYITKRVETKYILELDFIEVILPGLKPLDTGLEAPSDQQGQSATSPRQDHHSLSDSSLPMVPGAFSSYSVGNRNEKDPSSTQRLQKPPVVEFSIPSDRQTSATSQNLESSPKSDPEVKIIVGKLKGVVDIAVAKVLYRLGGLVIDTIKSSTKDEQAIKPQPNTQSKSEDLQNLSMKFVLDSLDLRLVERVVGEIKTFGIKGGSTNNQEEVLAIDDDTAHGETILQCIINNIALTYLASQKGDQQTASTNVKLAIRKFAITEGKYELLGFIPQAQTVEATVSKRANRRPKIKSRHDIVLKYNDNHSNCKIILETLPLKIYMPCRRIEEIGEYFGGLGSVLSLASNSSTPVVTPQVAVKQGVRWEEDAIDTNIGKRIIFDARLGGLVVELFVSQHVGGIGISTSPLAVNFNSADGVVMNVDECAIFGPQLSSNENGQQDTSMASISGAVIEFQSVPNGEDLEKLLKLITPSVDRYDEDDDLMIDVLLRQRRQGSVLRVQLERISARVDDINDLQQFSVVGDELARIATVAKYIPQDERPGLLSIIEIKKLDVDVNAGPSIGELQLALLDADICHVAAPSLLALAIGNISARRNKHEVLCSEAVRRKVSLDRVNDDAKTPMIRLRLIGDEPEPVVRVKVWNLNLEYSVQTLLAVLAAPEDATLDLVAAEMVASIALLADQSIVDAKPESAIATTNTVLHPKRPLIVDVSLLESSIGLNPLDLSSKAVVVLGDAKLKLSMASMPDLRVNFDMKKGYLLAIDDTKNLIIRSARESTPKRRGGYEELFEYTNQGYIPLLTVSSAKIEVKMLETASQEKSLDVEISDLFALLESCADSTQTMAGIFGGLSLPGPKGETIKYMTEVLPVDLLASLDEDAFGAPPSGMPQSRSPPSTISPSDSAREYRFSSKSSSNTSLNGQFIDSYHPNQKRRASGREAPGDVSIINVASFGKSNIEDLNTDLLASFHERVHVEEDGLLLVDDDHFGLAPSLADGDNVVPKIRKSPLNVKIRDIQLIWNMHDGYDWQRTRDALSQAVKKVEGRALEKRRRHERGLTFDESESDEESETYDVLFNSIYITLPQNRDPKQLSRDINAQIKGYDDSMSETGSYATTTTATGSQFPGAKSGVTRPLTSKFKRSSRSKLQLELRGVNVDFVLFELDGQELQSSVDIKVKDFEIIDNVPTSTWRKFVTYMRDAGVRETGIPMAHIQVDTLRPVPELAATELALKVKILPLRLHVDQDSLDFMTRFFEFKDDTMKAPTAKTEEPFIQRFEIDTVRVKLDFKPKRVDYAGLRSGRTTEFMNFFILEEADMELRRSILVGISGFERVGKDLNDIWTPDVKKNQLGGVLAGVAPVRSLVNIGTGVRDLVRVPVMEYKKDGRLVRSIQKGALKFAKTTTSEVVRFGAKMAIGTQTVLEKTEELLGGESSSSQPRHYAPHYHKEHSDEEVDGAVYSPYAEQPMGMYRGLVDARAGITRNFGEAKDAIMKVPANVSQGGSAQSAAAAVLRAAPTAVLRPMIGVTEALHKTLHGIDNSLDKEKRERIKDKYKKR